MSVKTSKNFRITASYQNRQRTSVIRTYGQRSTISTPRRRDAENTRLLHSSGAECRISVEAEKRCGGVAEEHSHENTAMRTQRKHPPTPRRARRLGVSALSSWVMYGFGARYFPGNGIQPRDSTSVRVSQRSRASQARPETTTTLVSLVDQ